MPRKTHAPLIAVFAAILILIGFLVFVLTYDDLRSKLWVQGMVGVVMALIIAVILFSIVYSAVDVKNAAWLGGVLGISGAAAFYLLLLPQIKPFFFPTHSVSGYVYFKPVTSQEALTPVPGVIAEIGTGQKSAPTDGSGRFAIDSVYGDDSNLQFQYGGKTYPVKMADYKENRYPIIPRQQTEPTPNKKPVTNQWKKDPTYRCEREDGSTYRSLTGFTLATPLPKDADELNRAAAVLHLKVSLPSGFGDITQPADLTPGNSIDFLETGDIEGRSQGWEWSAINENKVNVTIAICVGRKSEDKEPGPGDFQTAYWYMELGGKRK